MSPRQRNPADPRHAEVKALLVQYWIAEQNELVPDLPWSAGDAGALSGFLKANPRLSALGVGKLLQHRLDSEDHARGEPVKLWIGSLTRYAQGPLNKYRQPKERRNDVQRNRTDDHIERANGSTAAALRRLSGMADRRDS